MPKLATNSARMFDSFTPCFKLAWMCLGLAFLPDTMWSQTPDWMFALEGAYIGRMETPDPSGERDELTTDARLDGRRNLEENGFVLQWMISEAEGVVETLTTWHWEDDRVCETRIEGRQPVEDCWVIHRTTQHAVVLRRGGEFEGTPILFERTVERLPGQLRITDLHNNGDGKWSFHHGFVFEEMKPDGTKN